MPGRFTCAVRIEIPLRPVLNSNEREPRKARE